RHARLRTTDCLVLTGRLAAVRIKPLRRGFRARQHFGRITTAMPKPPVHHFRQRVAYPSFPGRDWLRIYLRTIQATVEPRQRSRQAYESVWKSFLTYLAEQGRNALTAEPKHAESFLKRYRPVTALRYGRLLERVYARHVADRVAPRNPFGELQSFLAQEEP